MNGTVLPENVVYIVLAHMYDGYDRVVGVYRARETADQILEKFKKEEAGSFFGAYVTTIEVE